MGFLMFRKRLTLSLACGLFLLVGTSCIPHETVTIDPDIDRETGNHNAIAVEAAGRVHIAYRSDNVYDSSSDWVRYSRRDPATGWTEPLYADPTDARAKKGIAIATDSTNVYVASVLACSTKTAGKGFKGVCANSATGDLVLASCGLDGTSTDDCWASSATVVSGDVGDWISLAAGEDEALHLSYWKSSTSELLYRRRAPGAAAFGGPSTIDKKVCALTGCSSPKPFAALKVDDARVHVAYREIGPFSPLGARRERIVYKSRPADGSGAWGQVVIAETSADGDEFGEKLGMALDADGTVHFCYFDKTAGKMRYARKNAESTLALKLTIPGGDFYDDYKALDGCNIVIFKGKPAIFFDVLRRTTKGSDVDAMSFIASAPDVSNAWQWSAVSRPDEVVYIDNRSFSAAVDTSGRLHIAYDACSSRSSDEDAPDICLQSSLAYLCVPGNTAACPVVGETPEEPSAEEPPGPTVGDPEDGSTGEVNDDTTDDTEEVATTETANEIDDTDATTEDTTDDSGDVDDNLIDDSTNLDLTEDDGTEDETEEENSGETETDPADPADEPGTPPEVPAVRGGCSLIP